MNSFVRDTKITTAGFFKSPLYKTDNSLKQQAATGSAAAEYLI